jgi:hypothetical protein
MNPLIIELHYLPNLQFFSLFLTPRLIIFDDRSYFIKQTYRNRAHIAGANGFLSLIVPVKKGRSHIPYKSIEIENGIPWQNNHWISILSAYNKSPFFQYYEANFQPFFHNKFRFLFDLNIGLMMEISKLVGIDVTFELLSHYQTETIGEFLNLRDSIHPKSKPPDILKQLVYKQVFSDRYDFIPGLSILDILFNTGPETLLYLQKFNELNNPPNEQ